MTINGILIPHAGFYYTKYCLYAILDKIININFSKKHIIYISTLHGNQNKIIISNNDKICNNKFKNNNEFYKLFPSNIFKIDNDIEKKEHSLIWNEIFLLKLNGITNMSVFYMSNNVDREIFFKFISALNANYNNN